MDTEELLRHRMMKFRKIGGFQEGVPIDPKKKLNMKKKEVPVVRKTKKVPIGKTPVQQLEVQVEKVKQEILKAKESSTGRPDLVLNKMIQKLKKEVDFEFSAAVKAMGLKDRLATLREQFSKANSPDQLIQPALKGEIEKLRDEINQGLFKAPNYENLRKKLDMLNDLSQFKALSVRDVKEASLKQEINKKFAEVLSQPNVQEKYEALRAEIENSGASTYSDLDPELRKKIDNVKKEIQGELVNALNTLGLDVEVLTSKAQVLSEQSSLSLFKPKIEMLNEEINQGIDSVVNRTDLKDKIELLKLEVAKAGKTPDATSKNRIWALEQQIKQSLAAALESSDLKKKHETLREEILETAESGFDPQEEGDSSVYGDGDARIQMNLGAEHTFA